MVADVKLSEETSIFLAILVRNTLLASKGYCSSRAAQGHRSVVVLGFWEPGSSFVDRNFPVSDAYQLKALVWVREIHGSVIIMSNDFTAISFLYRLERIYINQGWALSRNFEMTKRDHFPPFIRNFQVLAFELA